MTINGMTQKLRACQYSVLLALKKDVPDLQPTEVRAVDVHVLCFGRKVPYSVPSIYNLSAHPAQLTNKGFSPSKTLDVVTCCPPRI